VPQNPVQNHMIKYWKALKGLRFWKKRTSVPARSVKIIAHPPPKGLALTAETDERDFRSSPSRDWSLVAAKLSNAILALSTRWASGA
jgi:hypothetical protein